MLILSINLHDSLNLLNAVYGKAQGQMLAPKTFAAYMNGLKERDMDETLDIWDRLSHIQEFLQDNKNLDEKILSARIKELDERTANPDFREYISLDYDTLVRHKDVFVLFGSLFLDKNGSNRQVVIFYDKENIPWDLLESEFHVRTDGDKENAKRGFWICTLPNESMFEGIESIFERIFNGSKYLLGIFKNGDINEDEIERFFRVTLLVSRDFHIIRYVIRNLSKPANMDKPFMKNILKKAIGIRRYSVSLSNIIIKGLYKNLCGRFKDEPEAKNLWNANLAELYDQEEKLIDAVLHLDDQADIEQRIRAWIVSGRAEEIRHYTKGIDDKSQRLSKKILDMCNYVYDSETMDALIDLILKLNPSSCMEYLRLFMDSISQFGDQFLIRQLEKIYETALYFPRQWSYEALRVHANKLERALMACNNSYIFSLCLLKIIKYYESKSAKEELTHEEIEKVNFFKSLFRRYISKNKDQNFPKEVIAYVKREYDTEIEWLHKKTDLDDDIKQNACDEMHYNKYSYYIYNYYEKREKPQVSDPNSPDFWHSLPILDILEGGHFNHSRFSIEQYIEFLTAQGVKGDYRRVIKELIVKSKGWYGIGIAQLLFPDLLREVYTEGIDLNPHARLWLAYYFLLPFLIPILFSYLIKKQNEPSAAKYEAEEKKEEIERLERFFCDYGDVLGKWLVDNWISFGSRWEKRCAIRLLAKLRYLPGKEKIMEQIRSRDSWVKYEAVKALANFPDKDIFEKIQGLLKSKNSNLRWAAFIALRHCNDLRILPDLLGLLLELRYKRAHYREKEMVREAIADLVSVWDFYVIDHIVDLIYSFYEKNKKTLNLQNLRDLLKYAVWCNNLRQINYFGNLMESLNRGEITIDDVSRSVKEITNSIVDGFVTALGIQGEELQMEIEEWPIDYLMLLIGALPEYDAETKEKLKSILRFTCKNSIIKGAEFRRKIQDELKRLFSKNTRILGLMEKKGLDIEQWLDYRIETNVSEKGKVKTDAELYDAAMRGIKSGIQLIIEKLKEKGVNPVGFTRGVEKLGLPEETESGKYKMQQIQSPCIDKFTGMLQYMKDNMPKKYGIDISAEVVHILENLEIIRDVFKKEGKDAEEDGLIESFKIRIWDRDPRKDLFQGNYTHCCIAMGNPTLIDYMCDLGMQVVEIVRDNGRVVGQTWLWIGEDEKGEPVLVLDNVEINNNYKKYSEQFKEALFSYCHRYAKAIGIKRVYMGGIYNDMSTSGMPRASLKEIYKLGGFIDHPYYLEARKENLLVVNNPESKDVTRKNTGVSQQYIYVPQDLRNKHGLLDGMDSNGFYIGDNPESRVTEVDINGWRNTLKNRSFRDGEKFTLNIKGEDKTFTAIAVNRGKIFLINGDITDVIPLEIVKAILHSILGYEDFKDLAFGDGPIILNLCKRSEHLFGDCLANRVVFINNAFLKVYKDMQEKNMEESAKALLQIGLEHELLHELRNRGKEIEKELQDRDLIRMGVLLGSNLLSAIGYLSENRMANGAVIEQLYCYFANNHEIREHSEPAFLEDDCREPMVFRRLNKEVVLLPHVLRGLRHMASISRDLDVELQVRIAVRNGIATDIFYYRDPNRIAVITSGLDKGTIMDSDDYYSYGERYINWLISDWKSSPKDGQGENVVNPETIKKLKVPVGFLLPRMKEYKLKINLYSLRRRDRYTVGLNFMKGFKRALDSGDISGYIDFLSDLAYCDYVATKWWSSIYIAVDNMEESALIRQMDLDNSTEWLGIHTHPADCPSPPSTMKEGGDIYCNDFMKGGLNGNVLNNNGREELFLFFEPDKRRKKRYKEISDKFWDEEQLVFEDLRSIGMKPVRLEFGGYGITKTAVDSICRKIDEIISEKRQDLVLNLVDGSLKVFATGQTVYEFEIDLPGAWNILNDKLGINRNSAFLEVIPYGLDESKVRELMRQVMLRSELMSRDNGLSKSNLDMLKRLAHKKTEKKRKITISSKFLVSNVARTGPQRFSLNQDSVGLKYLVSKIKQGFELEIVNESEVSGDDLKGVLSTVFDIGDYFGSNDIRIIELSEATQSERYRDGILLLHENSSEELNELQRQGVNTIRGEKGLSANVIISVGIYKILNKNEDEMRSVLLNLGYTAKQINNMDLTNLTKLPSVTNVLYLINDIAGYNKFINTAA